VVPPGIYREQVKVRKKVTLRAGADKGQVVLESTGAPCLDVQTGGVVSVTGITFRHFPGPADDQYDAIRVTGKLSLDDCDLESSAATNHSAVINVDGEADIRNSRVRNGFVGVRYSDGARGTVTDCEVTGAAHIGFVSINDSSPHVSRCRITGKHGLYVISSGGSFTDCTIEGLAETAAVLMQPGSPVLRNCLIKSDVSGAIFVRQGSRGTIEDCRLICDEGHWSAQIGEADVDAGNPTGSNPTFRRSQFNNGVVVFGPEQGAFESCDITSANGNCFSIEDGGNPVLRGSKVHHGVFGVAVLKRGMVTLEDSEITDAQHTGVVIADEAEAAVRRCTITRNKEHGVSATSTARGIVEECDIRGNGSGAWDVAWLSGLKRKNNKDKGR
jgi:hypothetical protein